MSHDYGFVIVPPTIPLAERPKWVHRQIAPYTEVVPGEPCLVPCWCVLTKEGTKAIDIANEQVGNFASLWRPYDDLPKNERPEWRDYPPVVEWQRVAEKVTLELIAGLELDPDCPDCHGRRMMEAKANFSCGKCEYYHTDTDDNWTNVYTPHEIIRLLGDRISFYVTSVITPDGVWHAPENTTEGDALWRKTVEAFLDTFPDHEFMLMYVNT